MNTILVDFSRPCGKMKIMHAVNNGPAGDRVRNGTNNFDLYREAGIPYARNHDASYYHGYGGEFIVDVHRIFRDFDADVNDPASYEFLWTDRYVTDIESVGTHTFYRLGAAIEFQKKVGCIPPKDFQKWAEICEHIIRHYTEGWADGFHYDIEYWEIWNEPNCGEQGDNPCWDGTPEQFLDLFLTAVRHLKGKFPHLKIGGPALYDALDDRYNDMILDGLKKAGLTIDFFSFHGYRTEPSMFTHDIQHAYDCLKKYGMEDTTELILNEWNYVKGWHNEEFRYTLRTIKGLKGSSFIVGVMCAGQKSPLDMLMYYDATPSQFNGMFETNFLEPLKGYYPFPMYSQLYKMGTQVTSESDDSTLHHVAARGDKTGGVLLTHYSDDDTTPEKEVAVQLQNLPSEDAVLQVYLLDETHDMTLLREEHTANKNCTLFLKLPLFTTYLIRICSTEE